MYLAARRVGVEVLEFDPTALPDSRLTQVARIQMAEYPVSTHVRQNADGSQHLIVSDYGGGIRVYRGASE